MIISGRVIGGLQQARQLGYPTANVDVQVDLDRGVYAAWVSFGGQRHGAALMVGGDFGKDKHPKVEAHIIDMPHVDLYGQELSIECLQRVSNMKPLAMRDELLRKIKADLDTIKEILRNY